jgi:hypothetical protein
MNAHPLTGRILQAGFEVSNVLGCGFLENRRPSAAVLFPLLVSLADHSRNPRELTHLRYTSYRLLRVRVRENPSTGPGR